MAEDDKKREILFLSKHLKLSVEEVSKLPKWKRQLMLSQYKN